VSDTLKDLLDIDRFYEGVVEGIKMSIDMVNEIDPYAAREIVPKLLAMIEEVIGEDS